MRDNQGDRGRPSQTARQPTAPAAPFFLAVYRSAMGASRIYRVYPDASGLSFLGLGPPHPWIDVESARKLDDTHWAVRSAQAIRKGVAIAIAGVSAAAGVLGLALLKAAFKDAPKVLDLILFILTAVGVFLPLGLLVLTASIRLFTRRVTYLDSLDGKQIRNEADSGTLFSFWAAATDIVDVSIDSVDVKGPTRKAAALLSFTDQATGKWKMELVTLKDTKAADRAFRQLLGEDKVAVNLRLKKD
ncbi:MAG: hypothetical protein ACJ8FY_25950 [Gemmataceae bacterium]